jgi:hypothetical protein
MIDGPYTAIADCQFAIVDAADISSSGYLCQRRNHRDGRAASGVILACHQSGNLIVYAKELA